PSLPSSSFFFTDPSPTHIYTLSLHDALPISPRPLDCRALKPDRRPIAVASRAGRSAHPARRAVRPTDARVHHAHVRSGPPAGEADRKSTRLNSSHVAISYAVFCLKKKKKKKE